VTSTSLPKITNKIIYWHIKPKGVIMVINADLEIASTKVEMDGASNVDRQILIGPDDGSDNIIMRRFTIHPGGYTPHHNHNFEHVIKVMSGKGIAVDENGQEHHLQSGQSLFVKPNDMHQFKNLNTELFEFLCIIPNPEKLST
jgi:quercetin dioxygenase-like cupin family protein